MRRGPRASFWWALALSVVIGSVITALSWNNAMNRKEKIIAVVVAAFNVLLLAGSALGVGSLASGVAASPSGLPAMAPSS